MSFSRHITRNFNANKTNRIRYDDDDFTCTIHRFDKTYEKHYTTETGNVNKVNGERVSFHGMPCYRSPNTKNLEISFIYNAKEKSDNYRIELLYANLHKESPTSSIDKGLPSSASIKINGEVVKNSMTMLGLDVNFSRNYQYCTLKKGDNKIEYSLSSNTIFLGIAVKKYDVWEAKRHNTRNDDLTLIKATVEHTEELDINTMTCEFMYHHKLDEILEPTNPNANRSGLVFDFRDEINLYVKDTTGADRQVFGGYISTVEVDDDLTKVTMECADRLIDLDRRYCLSEITTNGYSLGENDKYNVYYDYHKNYDNYSDPIKFLLKNNEIFLRSNLKIGEPLVDKVGWKLATYNKDSYHKFTTNNMSANAFDNSVTLRNGADTLKPQSCVIYDAGNNTIELNKYPHLYLHYGLGVEKWEEKVEESSTVTVLGSTKANETWIKRANAITKATGNDAIKPIWKWVSTNVKQVHKRNFYQSSSKTYSSKRGNCCCKTELMLDLLNAKEITNLQYVHTHTGSRGHVFAKVNGYYVDPSTQNESKGWHNYIKGYGGIVKVTDYPNKPF